MGPFTGFSGTTGYLLDLPPVGGAVHAFGDALNDRDQVVGNELDAHFNEVIAALWSGGRGYDLNTLVAPTSFQMISADYINDQGEIFGHGVYTSGPNSGDQRVFVLYRNPSVPLPSKSTAAAALPAARLRDPLADTLHGSNGERIVARMRHFLLSAKMLRMHAAAWPVLAHAGATATLCRRCAALPLHRADRR